MNAEQRESSSCCFIIHNSEFIISVPCSLFPVPFFLFPTHAASLAFIDGGTVALRGGGSGTGAWATILASGFDAGAAARRVLPPRRWTFFDRPGATTAARRSSSNEVYKKSRRRFTSEAT